jgi:hypothetical protein
MNAFCASENFDAFIVLRSSQPGDVTAENSSSERSSFRGSDQSRPKANHKIPGDPSDMGRVRPFRNVRQTRLLPGRGQARRNRGAGA